MALSLQHKHEPTTCEPPLVFVSCYNTFGNLAHAPQGTPAAHCIYTYRLNTATGDLTLLSVCSDTACINPAFMCYHPTRNILYACTESILEAGDVVAYAVSPTTGQLSRLASQSAKGTSTCYLTIDLAKRNMLFVNYWDSTIGTLPLEESGLISREATELLTPPVKISKTRREDHLSSRQSEAHAHAIVLDPVHGRVAYVPDLGQECVMQYVYDETTGRLQPAGRVAAGLGAGPHGPRYIQFHPTMNVGYLVNELGSSVAVFEFLEVEAATLLPTDDNDGSQSDSKKATTSSNSSTSQTTPTTTDTHTLARDSSLSPDTSAEGRKGQPTLRLIQMVRTIPAAYPRNLNTCGLITVDPSGKYVLVSNRGHNSIAVFRVNEEGALRGTLSVVGYCHTWGRTPRHFHFDSTGRFLIVANQDTDKIAVFAFDNTNGHLRFTGNLYDVPSPNFVCVQTPHSIRRTDVRLTGRL